MKTYTYNKTRTLFRRATKVIPGGIYGHLSPAPLVPATAFPMYAARAKGSRFWDIDGNEFIDYMCAYGPVILGYNYYRVDEAARHQYERGNCVTTPAPVMVELAELLVDTVTIADWAFFAVNGADITRYALMVAKAATGRRKTVMIKGGYHGSDPQFQAPVKHGVTEEDCRYNIRIAWNDFEAFENVVNGNPGEIAAFMASPYHHPNFTDNEMPADGYWRRVETLCRKEGIVLVVDDVRCGFRLDMAGSNEYFGFNPDLICFGKALGNGYPISALVGTDALKSEAAKVFYTGSYWFSAAPMAAAFATLTELNEINGIDTMRDHGIKLWGKVREIAGTYGYDLKVSGHPAMPYLRITNDESQMLHQAWCRECTLRGAYFTPHHNWFLSTAHSDNDIRQTLEIVDNAFRAIKREYGDKYCDTKISKAGGERCHATV